MMSIRVIFLALSSSVFAAGVAEADKTRIGSAPVGDVYPQHRSLVDIRADAHAALRAEASTRRMGDNTPEVLRLIDAFHELAVHPQRDESVSLRRLGLQLRSRLERVRDQIERHSSDPDRRAAKQVVSSEHVVPAGRVLAQQVGLPGGAAMGRGAGLAGAPAAAGRPNDFGPELVELIQQTISPATWDINGGNGSVVYFAPLRALVVRAPADVHQQVGGALGQLRADQ